MGVDTLIGILKTFKENNPNAVVYSVSVIDSKPDCARLYWYNDNDGGHIDFYF